MINHKLDEIVITETIQQLIDTTFLEAGQEMNHVFHLSKMKLKGN